MDWRAQTGFAIQVIESLGIWAAVVVSIVLALFGERLRKLWNYSRLVVEIPERYPVLTFFGPSLRLDVYYLHLFVRNTGTERGDDVEVLVEQIEAVQQDGTVQRIGVPNPTNLPVASGGGATSGTIHNGLGMYFDLGHIADPEKRDSLRFLDSRPDIKSSEASFALEYLVLPNAHDHVLRSGTYRIHIVVVARNSQPVRCVVELNVTGRWANNEQDMRRDGVGMRIV